MKHEKHKVIGDIISKIEIDNNDVQVILDEACQRDIDNRQQIPLFTEDKKSSETRICNVDIAIIFKNKMRVLIEIEETGIIPTKICGKFLTSAICKYYIHENNNNEPVEIENALFIQILNSDTLQPNSRKKLQGNIIEEKINALNNVGSISKYHLFWYDDIMKDQNSLNKEIKDFLNI